MSQAKVDKYKQEKANRKELIAKEKRKKMLVKIGASAILVALVAWVGISVGVSVYESRPKDKIFVQISDIEKYLDDLYAEETESTESTETTEK
jgi:hypothetical protein